MIDERLHQVIEGSRTKANTNLCMSFNCKQIDVMVHKETL